MNLEIQRILEVVGGADADIKQAILKCWEILQISHQSDKDTINKAYKKKTLEIHPDKNLDAQQDATAAQKFLSTAREAALYPEIIHTIRLPSPPQEQPESNMFFSFFSKIFKDNQQPTPHHTAKSVFRFSQYLTGEISLDNLFDELTIFLEKLGEMKFEKNVSFKPYFDQGQFSIKAAKKTQNDDPWYSIKINIGAVISFHEEECLKSIFANRILIMIGRASSEISVSYHSPTTLVRDIEYLEGFLPKILSLGNGASSRLTLMYESVDEVRNTKEDKSLKKSSESETSAPPLTTTPSPLPNADATSTSQKNLPPPESGKKFVPF